MKELLFSHHWLGTGTKGVLGFSIPMALLSWADAGPVWQMVAGCVGAYILLTTAYSITLEAIHRKRRDRKERREKHGS